MIQKLTAKERYEHYLKYPYGRYKMVEIFGPSIHGAFSIHSFYFDYFGQRHDEMYELKRIDSTSAANEVESQFFLLCRMFDGLIEHIMYEWNPDTRCHDKLVTEMG